MAMAFIAVRHALDELWSYESMDSSEQQFEQCQESLSGLTESKMRLDNRVPQESSFECETM